MTPRGVVSGKRLKVNSKLDQEVATTVITLHENFQLHRKKRIQFALFHLPSLMIVYHHSSGQTNIKRSLTYTVDT